MAMNYTDDPPSGDLSKEAMIIYIINIIYLFPGCTSAIICSIVIYTFIARSNLHFREYLLPFCSVVWEFVFATGWSILAIYRLALVCYSNDMYFRVIPWMYCFVNPASHIIVISRAMKPLVNVSICMDRLIAINSLHAYSNLGRGTRSFIVLLPIAVGLPPWFYLFSRTVYQFRLVEPNHTAIAECSPFSTYYLPILQTFYSGILAAELCSLFLTCCVMTSLWYRLRRSGTKSINQSVVGAARKRNARITTMLAYHLVAAGVMRTVPLLIGVIFDLLNTMYGYAMIVLALVSCLNDVVFFCWKNDEFRLAMRQEIRALCKCTEAAASADQRVSIANSGEPDRQESQLQWHLTHGVLQRNSEATQYELPDIRELIQARTRRQSELRNIKNMLPYMGGLPASTSTDFETSLSHIDNSSARRSSVTF